MNNHPNLRRKKVRGFWAYLLQVKQGRGLQYNEWYNVIELCELPECTINVSQMRSRLTDMMAGRSDFKTLWEAVKTPLSAKATRVKIEDRPNEHKEFYDNLKLWAVPGSLKNKRVRV